jgi:hypothetical protein
MNNGDQGRVVECCFIRREQPHVILGSPGPPAIVGQSEAHLLEPTLEACTLEDKMPCATRVHGDRYLVKENAK